MFKRLNFIKAHNEGYWLFVLNLLFYDLKSNYMLEKSIYFEKKVKRSQ